MKSCPSCHRNYDDETMLFCLDDGTALLLPAGPAADSDATWVLPPTNASAPTVASSQSAATLVDQTATVHVGPGATATAAVSATNGSPRKSPLPWILGIVVVLGISALGAAFIVSRALLGASQRADQVSAVTSSPTPADPKAGESPASTPANSSNSPRPAIASSPGRDNRIGRRGNRRRQRRQQSRLHPMSRRRPSQSERRPGRRFPAVC